ncbi:MAG: UDP-N-acetylmuramate dehydrogenase [Nautilia sp.]|nr:MAG: UDP-N-acetylmuramate dehydrogenase [Nautilia sp.]
MIIDFSKFSTIQIGSKLNVKIINEENYNNEIIIGRASNSLVCSGKIGILDDRYNFITIKNNILKVGAKTSNRALFNFAKQNNLAGFEFLAKLPGSIGGTIKMNAGMKNYEISNNLISINNKDKNKFEFGYRYSNINEVIFYAEFEIKKGFNKTLVDEFNQMRKNQPKLPSLGSAFKNPKNNYAGALIEKVGLKGIKFGGVGFSEIHANFLVNYGNGSCEDVINAINEAKKRVFEEFGIKLEEEIKIFI